MRHKILLAKYNILSFRKSLSRRLFNRYSVFDHSITLIMIIFVLLLFSALQLSAQETKQINKKNERLGNIKNPDQTQGVGDKIEIKNSSDNAIITITDEGNNKGSITLPEMTSAPTTTTLNKLYNEGGTLKFDGSSIGGGATQIDDLTDAKYDGSSLFIGNGTGTSDDGNNKNTAIGKDALKTISSGTWNAAIGYEALKNNTTGFSNSATGSQALLSNTSGQYNTANGASALSANTSGSFNVSIGFGSQTSNTTGNRNVALGHSANGKNEQGSNNTMIGHAAGVGTALHNKSGNVFLGYTAGFNESGDNKLYIENSSSSSPLIWGDFGTNELKINGDLHVTGNFTSDGSASEINNLTDAIHVGSSLFLGNGAGVNDDQSNNWNTAVGYNSLNDNVDGNRNAALGFSSLRRNTKGEANTAVGYLALNLNILGNYNVAVGEQSLGANTGSYNTAIGRWALLYNSSGQYNVGVGTSANGNNETGIRNTMIGYQAGLGTSKHNKSDNVFIGHKAGYNETGSAKLYIDNSATSSPLIWGDFSANRLVINGNSGNNINNRTFFSNGLAGGTAAWFNDSDSRLKENIHTISSALDKVNAIRGVNYEWKDKVKYSNRKQIGFIAQEVEKIVPEIVDNSNDHYSMQYAPIAALLVEAIKELTKQNNELTNQLSKIKSQNEVFAQRLSDIVMNQKNAL